MELGEPDESGRRRPVPIPGSEFVIPIDTVVVAIGQGPNPLLLETIPGLQLNRRGYIAADAETGATSLAGVFAGGDIVTGAATVISAMGAGKRSASYRPFLLTLIVFLNGGNKMKKQKLWLLEEAAGYAAATRAGREDGNYPCRRKRVGWNVS